MRRSVPSYWKSRFMQLIFPGLLIACLWLSGCGRGADTDKGGGAADAPHASEKQQFPDGNGTLWHPHLEWRLENAGHRGNPFDVMASVTFTHQESGRKHRTFMYYDGKDAWRFRFTGTLTGVWNFTTQSDDPVLNGHGGTITIASNPDSNVKGFLVPAGTKFAHQVGEAGELKAFLFNVYQDNLAFPADYSDRKRNRRLDYIRHYPAEAWATEYLEKARRHGSDVLFMALAHQWLQEGALTYEEHNSRNPDLSTFEMIERVITTVHAQGGHLHIWLWGDEERKWTPIGLPGGINGEVDRRLQRYIAARLGPLPGWSISYGFDLHEWVRRSQVQTWGAYLNLHSGWPRILAAREERGFRTPHNMTVYSNDARPTADFYDTAVKYLNHRGGRPVLFERRFLHGRDKIWTMQSTRRAMWQFTMAGGAGAHWGVHPTLGTSAYPDPAQLATHHRFWQDRFLLKMRPSNGLTDGYALQDLSNPDRLIFYRESTSAIRMDLTRLRAPQPAVAIDTKLPYAEIILVTLSADRHIWNAPYRSDWAVAVGRYGRTD